MNTQPLPHFVRDYRRLFAKLAAEHPSDEAMGLTVGGGDFDTIGAIEADLLAKFGFGAGQMLIDVGCGSGRLSTQLAKRFGNAISYLGIDVVPEMLEYARQHAAPGYQFEPTSGLKIPAADSCADFVCAFSVFTHLRQSETASYLQDAHRTLRSGGLLVFSFLELPCHARIFIASSVRGLFGKCHPENHFLSRRTILQLAADHGFVIETVLPLTRRGLCWSLPDHSIAVLRKK